MIYQPQHWIADDGWNEATAWELVDGKTEPIGSEYTTHPTVWRLLECTAVGAPDLPAP